MLMLVVRCHHIVIIILIPINVRELILQQAPNPPYRNSQDWNQFPSEKVVAFFSCLVSVMLS
jgi:hypothetical protein